MKITRGEYAGDRNEGRVRWESVKQGVQPFERSKWKGRKYRKVLQRQTRSRMGECERKTDSERRGKRKWEGVLEKR